MDTILNETKLSRVWQLFTDDTKVAALVTAFRSEYDRDTNVQRNKELIARLRNLGYGVVIVDGFWVENPGTDQEVRVSEDSILVSASGNLQHDFAKKIHNLANSYDQEAAVVKDHNGTRLIFKDGSIQQLGTINPGQLGNIYTRLRTNKKASTFLFREERFDPGYFQRLAGIKS